jgi:hypothetical protein
MLNLQGRKRPAASARVPIIQIGMNQKSRFSHE